MPPDESALASWTPEEIALGRRWVDAFRAIAQLSATSNYREPPRAPKPTSGLIEQQRLFRRLRP